MAKLKTSIDSSFWDFNVASPQLHEGWVKSVPGDPFPLDGSVASRVLRPRQLSVIGNGLPLPVIVPSLSPTSPKDLGSFCLQSLLLKLANPRWYLTNPFWPEGPFGRVEWKWIKMKILNYSIKVWVAHYFTVHFTFVFCSVSLQTNGGTTWSWTIFFFFFLWLWPFMQFGWYWCQMWSAAFHNWEFGFFFFV